MEGRYRAYPEYRDSEVEWLGDLPKHWSPCPIKYVSKLVGTGGTPKEMASFTDDVEVNWFTPGDFVGCGVLSSSEKHVTILACDNGDAKSYQAGAVLVVGIGATLGKVGICDEAFSCNQQVNVIVPNSKMNGIFMMHSLGVQVEQMRMLSNASTIGIMNQEKTKMVNVALPSIAEQRQIANFLDHETAKIDTLIEKQQQLIALLMEKRQAVISHAVTKGLNPDVPMKNSGVEWLGEVPAHWAGNYKLVNFSEYGRGSFVNGPFGSDLLSSELMEVGVPVVYIRDVKTTGYKRKSTVCVTEAKAEQLTVCRVISADVLIAKVGDPPGDSCVYPEQEPEAIITQDVIRIRVNRELVDPDYLSMLLNSDYGKTVIDDISVESTRKRVSLGDFKSTRFPLPPIEEQRLIAEYVDEKCRNLDWLISKVEQSISLSQERRTALISAAVTGKIDVRNWQPPTTQQNSPEKQ